MRCYPTERQAATAARRLHYHRERLRWIQQKMRDNEALLLLFLTGLDTDAAVLPSMSGGYRIQVCASSAHDVAVEKLVSKNPYEQLALRVGEREVA